MNIWINRLAVAGITLAPLGIMGALQGPDLIATIIGEPTSRSRGTEGDRRNEMLAKLTTRYVVRGREVTMAMRDGVEFAPVPFLNKELERAGAKWRVGSVDGVTAETYAVS